MKWVVVSKSLKSNTIIIKIKTSSSQCTRGFSLGLSLNIKYTVIIITILLFVSFPAKKDTFGPVTFLSAKSCTRGYAGGTGAPVVPRPQVQEQVEVVGRPSEASNDGRNAVGGGQR